MITGEPRGDSFPGGLAAEVGEDRAEERRLP
jgi:hypothetical protein